MGYPSSPGSVVPHPVLGGVPRIPPCQDLGWGTPSPILTWEWNTPHPDLGIGYPWATGLWSPPPVRVWTENITFPYPSDAGGKSLLGKGIINKDSCHKMVDPRWPPKVPCWDALCLHLSLEFKVFHNFPLRQENVLYSSLQVLSIL